MEENKITPREVLKSYFEKGDYPTQDQFAELIDSLKHKQDPISNKEFTIATNNFLANNGFITYYNYSMDDENFPIVVKSSDPEDQIILLGKGYGSEENKIYFFGNAPYTITTKEFSTASLKGTEYYLLVYQTDSYYMVKKLFGNNLPTIPDGFEFGKLHAKRFYLELHKFDFGHNIEIINTKIKFINYTDLSIQYRAESGNWGSRFVDKDIITDHYSMWDYLYFYYNADLTTVTQNIVCQVYNEDTGQLLTTGYLYAGQNNINIWGGGSANMMRNIRIECNYLNNQVIQNNQPTSIEQ
ncbi:hypothetical protein H9Q08_03675 [Chryseobacterium sp. PS-8]|uniref:Uncharacterized protein n=1 Tax=Chryseobacterium indicum TaxID=2766954 RepID=A0ABS9C1G9_9FLAO|nr:hypothetical protein [Chryseobacterium sp. PS-8]MCF2218395.1 hypothetical protein [Chryseobacterium sp. PS-8]